MADPTLLILPGDGIGPEVMAEVRKVIAWFGANGRRFRVEEDLVAGIGASMEGVSDPWQVMVTGTRAFLDACDEPAVKQIALVDAPAVLGWREWREVDERYGLGLMKAALGGAMEAGVLRETPLDALCHLMLGALSEAAFVIANADDPATARLDAETALFALLEGLRA